MISRPFSSLFSASISPLSRTRPHRILRPLRSFATKAEQDAQAKVGRVTSRLPRFLRGYMQPLLQAPVSHIVAFLVLHEITAIVPLFGLTAAFHYFDWLPPYISEGKWVSQGVNKFGNYFRKKGWLGELGDDELPSSRRSLWFGRGEGGVRLVVEIATAWAITKALLPVRLVLSVWGAPWFARMTVMPFTNGIRRLFRLQPVQVGSAASHAATTTASVAPKRSPAAGTGATSGGVNKPGL